jgi:hypothetical protein
MADNVETLGNFSNPVVPKPISKMTPMESLGEIEKAGQAQQASYKNLGEQTAEFNIKKAARLSEEATRQSDLGMAEIGKTRQALAEVATPTFKPTQETFISMSSVAGLIAFVGSAMGQQGKQSGKAAIDSMTGMMKGYQTGRQDLFRREQIKYDKELQTMKAMNDKLLKDLTLAQDVMKYDFAKGQADAAVAIAGYAGPVTKATFENQGLEKATNLTTKLSEGLININKISADIGLKYATLAQTKEIAQMKAAGATTGQIPKDKETNNQYLGRKNVINNINEIQTLLKDPQFSRLIGPETQFTPDIFNNLRTNFPQLSAKLARIQAIEFELGGKNLTKNEIDILRPIYSWKGITAGALNERLKLVKEDFADRNAIVEIRFPGLAPVGQKIDDYYKKGRSITEVSEIGGAESSDKYVTGKVYTDDSGNKAKYLGNGNWEDQ